MPAPLQTIRLIDPDGIIRDVPVESAATTLQDPRWRVPTHTDDLDRVAAQAREADYGGTTGAIKAGAAGVARGVTLGLSDVAARVLGGDQAAIDLSGLREEHPTISTGSEIVGAIAPAFLSGGESLPAS